MKLLELNFFAYPMQQFNRKGSLTELYSPKDGPQWSQLFPPIVLFLNEIFEILKTLNAYNSKNKGDREKFTGIKKIR